MDRPGEPIPVGLGPGEFEGRHRLEDNENDKNKEKQVLKFQVLQTEDVARIRVRRKTYFVQEEVEGTYSALHASSAGGSPIFLLHVLGLKPGVAMHRARQETDKIVQHQAVISHFKSPIWRMDADFSVHIATSKGTLAR